jgi:pimeloyl-ACP methyl ester carboxylesterase
MSRHDPLLEKTTSPDGTPIACWRSGQGPALLLIHGSTADHTRWAPQLALLEPHATVYAMDRRGRGASGDADGYTLAAEAADVAAVVDAVAEATGGPVDVLGHSYGALCALEAALLTTGMRRLVLYEPPLGAVVPPGFVDRLDEMLAQGRREDVVTTLFREIVRTPPEHLLAMMAEPSWPGRVAAAHTLARECRAEEDYLFVPARFAALSVPVLLMAGSDSPPELAASTATLAAALPGARVVTLAGQGHVAMTTAPDLFATEVIGYLRGSGSWGVDGRQGGHGQPIESFLSSRSE